MNFQQQRKLEDIAENIRANSYLKHPISSYDVARYWDLAVKANRKQGNIEPNDIVKVFTIKDEELKELIQVGVKAKKDYSRLEWFQLLLAIDHYFYTVQQVKRYLSFVDKSKTTKVY